MGTRNILEDSVTYQEIFNIGVIKGYRKAIAIARQEELKQATEYVQEMVLQQGTILFGHQMRLHKRRY